MPKKPRIYSKAGCAYYLMVLFLPVMFFLTDDWRSVFKTPWGILGILLFFGIPVAMILFRRTVSVFRDKITISTPALKRSRDYDFASLIYWDKRHISGYRMISHDILILKFPKKKVTLNQLEFDSFTKICSFLEDNYPEKKR